MPVNRTLKHVRETRRFDLVAVAHSTQISANRLRDFEDGTRNPSFIQIEKLAEAYGIAPYLLTSPLIPNLPETLPDFRNQTPRPAHLSPAGMRRIWAAEQISAFTCQIAAELRFEFAGWRKSLPRTSVDAKSAVDLRHFFDEWLAKRESVFRFSGSLAQHTLGAFRLFLESQGIIVNINDAPGDEYSGFFTQPDDGLPLTFVNRKIFSRKAQLFTAVHEYAHVLLNETGVSNPFVLHNSIERKCNHFAANFLAPIDLFETMVKELRAEIRKHPHNLIRVASENCLLSMHATAIRLRETDFIKEADLRSWETLALGKPTAEKDEEREAESQEDGAQDDGTQEDGAHGESKFGQPHARRISELGYLPAYVAKLAVEKKLIDSLDVQSGLSLSETLQEKAFALASRRMEAAIRT